MSGPIDRSPEAGAHAAGPPALMLEGRLSALEVRITFLDDLLDALNRTVYRQQQQIDRLVQAVSLLRQQAQTGAPAAAPDPRDEIPPHY